MKLIIACVYIFVQLFYLQFLSVFAANFNSFDAKDFHYAKYDFWQWDHSFLNWRNECEKYLNDSTVQTRITGGNLAEMNMLPYQVGLLLWQEPPAILQCGGVLITQKFVLTAAHCLFRAMQGRVFLGSLNYADANNSAAVYNVTWRDFFIYETYTYGGALNDIGLIYLATPAPLSAAVQIIPLARKFMTQRFLEGEVVTASGWGRLNDATADEVAPNLLLYYVDLPVMPQQECSCFYLPGLVRSRTHICTDGVGGRGTCEGDSGGPLTFYYANTSYLVGITAFGSAGGCEIGFPAVYTRITAYIHWIAKHTGLELE